MRRKLNWQLPCYTQPPPPHRPREVLQPRQDCELVLKFLGRPGSFVSGDSSSSSSKSMKHRRKLSTISSLSPSHVIIYQQPFGANSIVVFDGYLKPREIFSFVSLRHAGYPFSLTIYIDGNQHSRVNTCCEFRRRAGERLGGPSGCFVLVDVERGVPCLLCEIRNDHFLRKHAKIMQDIDVSMTNHNARARSVSVHVPTDNSKKGLDRRRVSIVADDSGRPLSLGNESKSRTLYGNFCKSESGDIKVMMSVSDIDIGESGLSLENGNDSFSKSLEIRKDSSSNSLAFVKDSSSKSLGTREDSSSKSVAFGKDSSSKSLGTWKDSSSKSVVFGKDSSSKSLGTRKDSSSKTVVFEKDSSSKSLGTRKGSSSRSLVAGNNTSSDSLEIRKRSSSRSQSVVKDILVKPPEEERASGDHLEEVTSVTGSSHSQRKSEFGEEADDERDDEEGDVGVKEEGESSDDYDDDNGVDDEREEDITEEVEEGTSSELTEELEEVIEEGSSDASEVLSEVDADESEGDTEEVEEESTSDEYK